MNDPDAKKPSEYEKLVKYCQNLSQSFNKININKTSNEKFGEKALKSLENNLSIVKKLCSKRKDCFEKLFHGLGTSGILINLLIKFYDENSEEASTKLKTLMVSCLADLSHFEALRNQISSNENCEKMCRTIANEIDEQVWSKICRLSANLCQDKLNIRYFLGNDFIVSLARCVEKSSLENIDLYFSIIRFLKYGCEKTQFRNEILSKRILVYVCRFMNRNKTSKYINDEFLRQFLHLIDMWQHPSCVEYSNQIVEGDTIEYLLWIYLDDHTDKNIDLTNKKLSFNLIHKFCKDYDSCRAEFGRVNGIKRFLDLIKNENNNHEQERMVEILCYLCREAVNRHRFKEQNLLVELMDLLRNYLNKDNSLSEKLINSICSFAHDQESLNYYLQNSIVDHFIDYLSSQFNSKIDKNIFSDDYFQEKYQQLVKCNHKNEECCLNKSFTVDDLKSGSCIDQHETSKKRKIENSNQTLNFKKTKFSSSVNNMPSLSPPQIRQNSMVSPTRSVVSPTYELENLFSPSYSFSPLSNSESMSSFSPIPSFSPTSSVRSNSAIMFESIDEYSTEKSIQFSPSISLCDTLNDENEDIDSKVLERSFSSEKTTNTIKTNIENVNKTEACIFYVFSLLSYGQFPSNYLLNEKFFDFLMSYLKSAPIRNPRALRIINRLTKNPQCFQYFLVNQFSYKLKQIFGSYTNDEEIHQHAVEHSKLENEMQNYLNSNNVFFEANVFPRLSSIEFQLNQNLKLHCITSSDNCYQSLLNLLRYGTLKERQSCAFQMPFILRNCKALENVMLHLNGLDLILDCIFDENTNKNTENFFKALLALNKVLKFINYKQNKKQLKENNDKLKSSCIKNSHQGSNDDIEIVEFLILNETSTSNEESKILKAKRQCLTKKCEYFNLMLNGSFSESIQTIKNQRINLKDINYVSLKCIFQLLGCAYENECDQFIELEKLSFNNFLNLIETCDRLMLFDLKTYLSSFIALSLLSKCTFNDCLCISIKYDCKYLLNACIEYLLTLENSSSSSDNLFIEYCFYFKNAIYLAAKYSFNGNSSLRSIVKNAISDIIKFNCWKY